MNYLVNCTDSLVGSDIIRTEEAQGALVHAETSLFFAGYPFAARSPTIDDTRQQTTLNSPVVTCGFEHQAQGQNLKIIVYLLA
jgi:hypothetical protein